MWFFFKNCLWYTILLYHKTQLFGLIPHVIGFKTHYDFFKFKFKSIISVSSVGCPLGAALGSRDTRSPPPLKQIPLLRFTSSFSGIHPLFSLYQNLFIPLTVRRPLAFENLVLLYSDVSLSRFSHASMLDLEWELGADASTFALRC